jgi:hypothetical protein
VKTGIAPGSTRTIHRHAPAAMAVGLFLLFTVASPALAQPSFTAVFGGTLDSFRPTGTPQESRENLAGAINVEHLFSDGRGRVAYDMDAGDYDSPGDWSFFQHTAGFTYRFGEADAGARKLYLNGSFVARSNGDAWTNAAYAGFGAGLNAEFHPREGTTLRTGYRTDYRSFDDYTALTQFEHRGFGSVLLNLPSRTTFIAEAQVGGKLYDGVVYSVQPVTVPVDMPATGGGTWGQGMNGMGRRWAVTPSVYRAADEQGSAGLVTLMGRVAQSLTDRTGVHAQVMVRETFGSVPPALVTTPAGFFEDGVYDDPFASDGVFVQVGVKRSFSTGAEIEATGWWADKAYTGAVATDLDGAPQPGSPLRQDTVTVGAITWSQPVLASKTGAVLLSAEIGYRFMQHRSNDAFYNYTSNALALGFTVGY